MSPDPRLTLRTSESASAAVEGVVRAARYWPTRTFGVRAPRLAIRRQPADGAEQLDELVFGELFDVLEVTDGYALGQARRDGYVGFVASDGLAERGEAPTHRLAAASSRIPWDGVMSMVIRSRTHEDPGRPARHPEGGGPCRSC